MSLRVIRKDIQPKLMAQYGLFVQKVPLNDNQQAVSGRPPWYAPAWACKWWHDIRHVCIWIGHQSPLLYVPIGLPVQPTKAAWWPWPFDLESGVRVTCDVGYLCATFSLPRPLCSSVRPMYTTDRHQTKASLNAPAYYIIINQPTTEFLPLYTWIHPSLPP